MKDFNAMDFVKVIHKDENLEVKQYKVTVLKSTDGSRKLTESCTQEMSKDPFSIYTSPLQYRLWINEKPMISLVIEKVGIYPEVLYSIDPKISFEDCLDGKGSYSTTSHKTFFTYLNILSRFVKSSDKTYEDLIHELED